MSSEGVRMIYNNYYCLTLKVNKCYLALACNTTNSVASPDISSNESWGVSYGIPLLHIRAAQAAAPPRPPTPPRVPTLAA